jgi:rapamycin-insensitive companion of mTOR
MDDMLAIRSIIDTLRIPSMDTRVSFILYRFSLFLTLGQEIILDMFFELLNIKTPDWFKTFIDGRRLTSKQLSRCQGL